jgi:DNA-binding PadR family transcriptional regulator
MSETRDKRRRTDLDQFVLALIDSGVSTPYEFQKAAGLSQGATIPALHRLLDARLVCQGKRGPRGRTDYKVTATGKRLLKDGWLALIEDGPSGDVDSDLRVALLALLEGGDRRLAADFLCQSADKKMKLAGAAEPTVDRGKFVQRTAILNRQGSAHGRIGGHPRDGRRVAPETLGQSSA